MQLHEDQQVVASLSFCGLGLLLMLALSLIGLNATAGGTLSPGQRPTLEAPSAIPVQNHHHTQLLP